jgi:hypothetical protein
VLEMAFAQEENQRLLSGQYVPPATPEESYLIHTQMHRMALQHRPDKFQEIGAHLVTHEQAKLMRTQMLMQTTQGGGDGRPNGPGSMPAGARGGVNPARMPQATGQTGLSRQKARLAPRS